MKLFQKSYITHKYSLDTDGKRKHGKIRVFLPSVKQLESFDKVFFSKMAPDEVRYLLSMRKFSIVFPIEENEYVDYQEMMRCGLVSKNIYTSPLSNSDAKTLFFQAVKGGILQVDMSEHGYYSFRDMVLAEFEKIDGTLDDMHTEIHKGKISNLDLRKEMQIYLTQKKFHRLQKDSKKEIWSTLISIAHDHSDEIVKRSFPKRAVRLLENFDPQEYKKLIHDVIDELNSQSPSDNNEVIMCLSDPDIQKDKEYTLGWIIDNTCSKKTAFENMKREADYIKQEIYRQHCVHFYRMHRKEMSREEKRLFQFCFFRREAFLYRIPIFDGLLRSFWSHNIEPIFNGLILKGINPNYERDNHILEERWKEFLSIYPYAIDNQKLYMHLKDRKKIKETINNNYRGIDLQILHAFVDGHEIDTIITEYGCSPRYCQELIERYKQDAKTQE